MADEREAFIRANVLNSKFEAEQAEGIDERLAPILMAVSGSLSDLDSETELTH